jgi:hypothetical protein
MIEGPLKSAEQAYDLHYETRQHRPGTELYVFKNVVVVVDTTGKNFKEFPELLFGTHDGDLNNADVLSKPKLKREGVDMNYICACIRKVSEVTGIQEFQFAPFGDDNHEQARLRLFKRFAEIRQSPDGFGYILKL